ncbi:MAG: amidohydrolase family protein [Cellvibrio sp.]|uniref:amidohydrolase family protein n=1 Tax=Cellvibrio sp. TaxID=1965322 RepID=UPI0031B24121
MKTNPFILILWCVLSLVITPAQARSADSGSLLIRNVTVITADATLSKRPQNVLIEHGKIQSIGTQQFKAETIIDGSGQYLIPGLIDSHVHLRGVPGVPEGELEQAEFYQQAVAQIPKSYLYAGFTTLLDLVNTKTFIDGWNSQPLAPKAHFCAPAPIPKGYPIALIPDEALQTTDAARYVLHDRHSHLHPEVADPELHTPSHLVSAMKADGARCVKIFYEKGFGKVKNLPVPSEAIVRELVTEAHKKNLPVFLHGNSQESYEFALATGVDMVVHGLWNAPPSTTPAELENIAQRLIKAKIAVQPSVQVIYGEQELLNPEFLQQPAIRHYMLAELINWYKTPVGQWMSNDIGSYFGKDAVLSDEQKYQKVKAVYQPLFDRVRKVSLPLNQKSLLVFGSDTPSGPIYTQFPGLNGRMEMDRWLAMGIPLADLFKALTIGNAKRMGLEKDIGSVAKHKQADLLLLGKNPLEDITAYDTISWVILQGKPIARDSLSAQKINKNL